jgi:hypothetical protein
LQRSLTEKIRLFVVCLLIYRKDTYPGRLGRKKQKKTPTVKNVDVDKMSKEKTPNETKHQMETTPTGKKHRLGQNIDCDKTSNSKKH